MKLFTTVFAATAFASCAVAQEVAPAATSVAPAATTVAPAASTVAPAASSVAPAASSVAPAKSSVAPATSGKASAAPTVAGDAYFGLKHNPTGSKYAMKPVRVVHARAQSDTPKWNEEGKRFVSAFGKDLESGYMSAMDSVNTASVEGALMFVQAECINQNARSKEDRCKRKNGVQNIVFYEVIFAQTNETIAQFQDPWATPEYGPMIPMDGGQCTPVEGTDVFSPGCLQFNGDEGQPNLGPFIGGENKEGDARGKYPGNYWFSFPNTCPQKKWKDKTAECRKSTRTGLCPLGVAPNGVDCTFTYNILGWVPLDDVVGITSIDGGAYKNFTEWCSASEKNVEFAGDDKTGEMTEGLPFWENPTEEEANKARAQAVVAAYASLLENKNSTQVDAKIVANFKPLPSPEELSAGNPACYESVKSCETGCKRESWAQLCTPCTDDSKECKKAGKDFKFPELEKAKTTLSEDEVTTVSNDTSSATPSKGKKDASGSKGTSSAASAMISATVVVATAMLSALLA